MIGQGLRACCFKNYRIWLAIRLLRLRQTHWTFLNIFIFGWPYYCLLVIIVFRCLIQNQQNTNFHLIKFLQNKGILGYPFIFDNFWSSLQENMKAYKMFLFKCFKILLFASTIKVNLAFLTNFMNLASQNV